MTTQHVPTIEQIRGAWDGIAAGFDEFVTPETLVLGKEIVRRIGIRPGTRVLDVAAGSGALSIPAARIGADVLATDIAPAMIERLNARARAEGLSSLRGKVMAGQALDLDDDTFDVSASINGVSVFPDMARGVAEMVRVTRPGGRVVVVAFGPMPKVEFIRFFAGAIQAAIPGATPLPTNPPPPPFQVADPEVLRTRLAGAGLCDVTVEPLTWETAFDSVQHLWQFFTSSNPIGAQLVAGLDAEQRTEVAHVLEGMLRERSAGAPGAVLKAELNVGTGTV